MYTKKDTKQTGAGIDAQRRADAHQELAPWLSGDCRTDNELPGRHI